MDKIPEIQKGNNLLFLDTETTGREKEDRLIQICYNRQGWSFPINKFYNPPVPISFEAMAVHHITNDDVFNMPSFKDSGDLPVLQKLLDDNVLVAHNAPFDIDFLEREGLKVNLFIDTLKIAKFLMDEPSYKLQYLRYRLGITLKEATAHDAEGDVAVLEAIFIWFAAVLSVSGKVPMDEVFRDMIEISQKPSLYRRFNFGKYKGELFEDIATKDIQYLHWLNDKSDIPKEDVDLKTTLFYWLSPNDRKNILTPCNYLKPGQQRQSELL